MPAFLVGDFRSFVPMVEIVLSVRADRYRVEAVVVVVPVEPGEQDLALVHPLVEYGIPVDARVDDQVRGLGYDDPVVDHRNPEGGDEFLFLNEDVRTLGNAVAVLVLDHDDPVTVGLGPSSPVVASFRNPDASLVVDVHVGRVVKERRLCPEGDLQSLFSHDKLVGRVMIDARGKPALLGRGLGYAPDIGWLVEH